MKKKSFTLLTLLMMTMTVWAQTAQNPKLSYQAVVRDNSNKLVTNSNIDVTISVLRMDNSLQYTQSFAAVPTNQNGLLSLIIGGEADWDDIDWLHSKIAVAITLPDLSVVKDTTEVNAVPLAINTMYSVTVDPSSLVQSNWTQADTEDPSFILNKPSIKDTVNTILNTGGYVTETTLDGRHYLTSDSTVIRTMQSDIATNRTDISTNATNIQTNTDNIDNLILHTTQDALRDSVAGQIHDSISNIPSFVEQQVLSISNDTIYLTGGSYVKLPAGFSGNYNDLSNKPTIPTTVAQLTDAANYLTTGAIDSLQNVQADWSQTTETADDYIKNKPVIPTIPTNVSAFTNDAGYLTKDSAVITTIQGNITANASDIANLTLHTAKSALRDSVAGQIHDSISNIPSFVEQQVLSISNDTIYLTGGSYVKLPAGFSGDYNALTNKPTIPTTVAGLSDAANYLTTGAIDSLQNAQADWNQTSTTAKDYIKNKPTIPTVPTNVSAFTNDAGYLTSDSAVITTMQNNIVNLTLHSTRHAIRDSVAGQIHDSISNIPSFVEQQVLSISNDTIYLTGGSYVKLPAGFSGNYNDLSNKPTIPTTVAQLTDAANYLTTGAIDSLQNVQADWSQTTETADDYIKNKPSLAAVATSGDYNDLTNKPSIRDTVNGILDTKGYLTSTSDVITTLQSDLSAAIGKEKTDSTTLAERIDALESASMNCNDVKDCIKDTLSKYTPTNDLCNVLSNCQFSGQSLADLLQGLSSQISSLQNQVDAQNRKIDSLSNLPHGGTGAFTCGSTVTDHQGNVYNTLQIGNQCWTKENMRCTTSPITGASILVNLADATSFGKKAFCYDNAPANADNGYGLLYNWYAAVDTFYTGEIAEIELSGHHRGICPKGWHVPSDGEWTDLTSFVKSQPNYRCGENEWDIAKALASKIGWKQDDVSINSCSVGRNSEGNNATGFSALPAGYYHQSNGFVGRGDSTLFWSSTSYNNYYTHDLQLSYVDGGVKENQYSSVNHGLSVRCVWDGGAGGGTTPSAPGGDNACCSELGARLDSLEHVISSQDSTINALNEQVNPFTCGTSKVKDVDLNEYNTVAIGNQCWMAQNLRTNVGGGVYPKYPEDHTKAGQMVDDSLLYGRLYTWNAMMKGAPSTNYPAGTTEADTIVQGICPTGWHVPSDAEWTQLTTYVKSKSEYQCDGADNIANALSAAIGWSYNTSEGCYAGSISSTINLTGFSAVPAGLYNVRSSDFSHRAFFWSTTEYDSNNAYYRNLSSNDAEVFRWEFSKGDGYSVRCVRDAGIGGTPGENETGGTTPSAPATMSCEQVMECMGDTLGKLNTKIEEQGTEIETLNGTVTTQGQTIETLNSTVQSQGETITTQGHTIDSLAHLVDSLAKLPHGGGEVADGQPCPGAPTVTDIDGNEYNTVKIGNQCWMKENLRTKTLTYGHVWTKTDVDSAIYGRYYDWQAAMQIEESNSTSYTAGDKHRGICPEGWHVPSDAEWDTLTRYVYNSTDPDYKCSGCSSSGWEQSTQCIANALSSSTGWQSPSDCGAGHNSTTLNATGFSAVPAGGCFRGPFNDFGSFAYFWSATQNDANIAWCRYLGCTESVVYSNYDGKDDGFSVRCLRDAGIGGAFGSNETAGTTPSTPVTMSCEQVMECMGDTLGKLNAKIENLQNTVVEQENIIDNLSYNVDYFNNLTPDGQPCLGAAFVKDAQNNKYSTVKIGSQCWMKENLRTNNVNGIGNVYTNTVHNYNVDSYGCLYDRAAVMQGASSTNYPESGDKVQGICPNGWHVPSKAEWETLSTYVSSIDAYQCDGGNANALSDYGWNSPDSCCAGYWNREISNKTGFSAVPAGFYAPTEEGIYLDLGNRTFFWSATDSWAILLSKSNRSVQIMETSDGSYSVSVRCLRDAGIGGKPLSNEIADGDY